MRKLAIVSFSFAAGVFAANYIIRDTWLFYASVGIAILGFGAFFVSGDKRLRAMLISFPLCIGLLWSWGYEKLFLKSARLLEDNTASLSLTVIDYPQKTDYGSRIYVRVSAEGNTPVKALLSFYDNSIFEAEPGDIIHGSFRFYPEDDSDIYNAQGVFLRCTVEDNVELEKRESKNLRYLPTKAAYAVKQKIDKVFPEDSAPFMRALITGDKSEMQEDIRLVSALKVTGVSHIVAVSGMHMSFIVSMIMLLCGRRKSRSFICIPFILAFMLFTGNLPSVVRAAIMQILIILAPMVNREADSWTNLGFALMLILLFNPYSVKNVGLQLSFAAVAGIILITPIVSKKLGEFISKSAVHEVKLLRKPIRFICATISSTVGAVAFTTPLTLIHFNYVSVISMLANLLVLWAVSYAFMLGVAACVISFILPPAGIVFALLPHVFVRYIIVVLQLLAKIPFAAVYTMNYNIRVWLIYAFSAITLLYLTNGIKHKIMLSFISVLAVFSIAIFFTLAENEAVEIAVLNTGQGQCVVVRSAGKTAVIDCGGNISGGAGNAAAEYLYSEGESEIECVILTHYHTDHTEGLPELFCNFDVKQLISPKLPEEGKAETLALAADEGIEYMLLDEFCWFVFGNAEMYFMPPQNGSGGEKCMAVMVKCGNFEFLLTGDMTAADERLLTEQYSLPNIEVLVVGHHGSKYSLSEELLKEVEPEAVVISVGRNNYGHPANETLEKLENAQCAVYRTDINGTIKIRTG